MCRFVEEAPSGYRWEAREGSALLGVGKTRYGALQVAFRFLIEVEVPEAARDRFLQLETTLAQEPPLAGLFGSGISGEPQAEEHAVSAQRAARDGA